MRRVLVLLLLVGCGPVAPLPANTGGGSASSGGGAGGAGIDRESLSGARLKNRYIEGDDGSRTPLGFQDTMRGEPCAFMDAEDGRKRCLPSFEISVYFPGLYFADSSCTEQVAVSSYCASAVYAYTTTSTCPLRYAMHQATRFVPTILFDGNGCVSYMPNPAQIHYRVGAKVEPSAFVAGTVKTE